MLDSPLSCRIDIKIGRYITVQVAGRCSLNYIEQYTKISKYIVIIHDL